MPIQEDLEFLTEGEFQQLRNILLDISILCVNLKVKKQEMANKCTKKYNNFVNTSSTATGSKKFCYWIGKDEEEVVDDAQ